MIKRIDTIIEEARKLTPEERDELMRRLPVELEDDGADGTPEEIEAALLEEVELRIEKAERGESIGTPSEIVHARVRERLRRL